MAISELHAGYVADGLRDHLDGAPNKKYWKTVLTNLSCFYIDRRVPSVSELPPILNVLDDLISRGMPTCPSCFVERRLATELGLSALRSQIN
jgi:hypothetical protein